MHACIHTATNSMHKLSPETARCKVQGAHVLVAVIKPVHNLLEEVARLVLSEHASLDHEVKQLAAGGILHDDAQVGWREEGLDVWGRQVFNEN